MKYLRLRASDFIGVEEKGVYPTRIVLIEKEDKSTSAYATHKEAFPYDTRNDGKPYLYSGAYFRTKEEAEKSFKERMDSEGILESRYFVPDTEYQGKK
jgi:hypothetical protein